jgi:hypothetical protein
MAKRTSGKKSAGKRPAKSSKKTSARKQTVRKKTRNADGAKAAAAVRKPRVSAAAIARAKKLEALDAAEPFVSGKKARADLTRTEESRFPETYIAQVNVSLNDPDHAMILSWTGPDAATQETGPFRTSPGAGLKGLNCNDAATSRRSGTLCTPKGTYIVEGFARRLNSDARATYVTWFVRRRGIALHYFPTVPQVPASHGCVRIQQKRIAQLIHDNARAGVTKVIVDGTWTKPPKQW